MRLPKVFRPELCACKTCVAAHPERAAPQKRRERDLKARLRGYGDGRGGNQKRKAGA